MENQNCNSCEILYINGVKCHETGCTESWKDELVACNECGFDFLSEEQYQTLCNVCLNYYNGLPGMEEY